MEAEGVVAKPLHEGFGANSAAANATNIEGTDDSKPIEKEVITNLAFLGSWNNYVSKGAPDELDNLKL